MKSFFFHLATISFVAFLFSCSHTENEVLDVVDYENNLPQNLELTPDEYKEIITNIRR